MLREAKSINDNSRVIALDRVSIHLKYPNIYSKFGNSKVQKSQFQQRMHAELSDMDAELSDMDAELSDMDAELSDMDAELSDMDAELSDMDAELSDMEGFKG